MKKINYLFLIAILASSCAVGTYDPMARNTFGAQTTVVLDKANFRVVREVEAVVEVNNSNLKRVDVEKSAYGQLLKNARLTGSQVLINVVIEQVYRKNSWSLKQYVAARGIVIEFLQENGQPVSSVKVENTPQPEPTEQQPAVQQPEPIKQQPAVQQQTPVQKQPAVQPKPVQQQPAVQQPTPTAQTVDVQPSEHVKFEPTANDYYIAYLFKTGHFNRIYLEELQSKYNKAVTKLGNGLSLEELKKKMSGHDPELEKYWK